jgi:hypothetical protein
MKERRNENKHQIEESNFNDFQVKDQNHHLKDIGKEVI